MVDIARENARHAGVADEIRFSVHDFRDVPYDTGYLVTNPPYGKRLGDDDLFGLYSDLESVFLQHSLSG